MTTATAEVLPYLPQSWLDGINAGEYKQRSRVKANRSRQMAWIKERPASKGDPCKVMSADLEKTVELLEEGGSAHDRTNERVYRLIALAYEGHRGLFTALKRLSKVFTDTVSADRRADRDAGRATGTIRSTDEARREFQRMWTGAVNLMLGNASEAENPIGEGAAACSCWDEPEGLGWSSDGGGGAEDPWNYGLHDVGNATHLADLTGGKLVWTEAQKSWRRYNEETGMWVGSNDVEGKQAAMLIGPRLEAAAQQYWVNVNELEKAGKGDSSDANIARSRANKLTKHSERSMSNAGLRNMLDVMRTLDGVSVSSNDWDRHPSLLGLGDGTVLVLGTEGVEVRPAEPRDHLTKRTGVPYVPGATDPAWDSYLETFLADDELRDWVQRLMGYSLAGGNPERLMVFLHGPTSSGKSTLIEAIASAIGDYAASFSMSIFRENQDERARPDILRIVRRRFAFSSEAGSEWHLHNDSIKRIVGGDRMPLRDLFARSDDMFDDVPHFTPFIATNAIPRINGADQATWRRLRAVPFDSQVFGDADDTAARDLLRVSSSAQAAVLSWLVAGWQAYCERGLDDVPAAVSLRTMMFRESVSDFHMWLAESCQLDGESSAEPGALFNSYRTWCNANDVKERDRMSQNEFSRKLTGEGVGPSRPVSKKVDGVKKTVRVRTGIKLHNG